MRLSRATLADLPADVMQPALDGNAGRRIVHLGLGAFARAHQAVYTEDAAAAGDRWRITGASLHSSGVRDALMPQDGLYTVTERSNGAMSVRVVGVVDTVLVGTEDRAAIVAAIAAPETHIVTLTVTEKGYHRDAAGGLDAGHPAVAADLRGEPPQTIYGYLAAALARRRVAGAGGLTVMSCDNLSGNGRLLARLLAAFLRRQDAELADWASTHVAAPDTMVDRIVPAATAAERALIAERIGLDDAGAIVTEPFRQWIIEDRFAGPRPRWEAAGAQIVGDVAPFELAKLRLLNASHSALAYLGLQLGHTYVHEAVDDPRLRAFVSWQMRNETIPILAKSEGLDHSAYADAILTRFDNAELRHRLDQIAMDGSQKLPQRWFATIADRRARGLDSPLHLCATAAWIAYTADATTMASDPLSPRYAAIWGETGGEPGQVVRQFVADVSIVDPATSGADVTIAALVAALSAWRRLGPAAALDAVLKDASR